MDKIVGGDPSAIRKGNLIECKGTIHPINMINGTCQNRGLYIPTKVAGPSAQGVVKKELEVVRVESASLCPIKFSLNYELTVECLSMK